MGAKSTILDVKAKDKAGNEYIVEIPSNLDDEGLKSAYTEADRHAWTKADLEAYEYAKMRETDEIARELFV